MIFPDYMLQMLARLQAKCVEKNLTIAVAESCTGGLLSALLTQLPGSSAMFTHGFITYANAAKISMLGVDAVLIETHGAVSTAVAQAMAAGALRASGASLAVAITGVAGPGGGTAHKPVGLVCFALAQQGRDTQCATELFSGDRDAVRMAATSHAVSMLLAATNPQP